MKQKKETNAYEDIYEKFFDKNQGYQITNINYLFVKNLDLLIIFYIIQLIKKVFFLLYL